MDPETLPRDELAGLHVRVCESTDPTLVGIEGEVVDETMHTLLVAVDDAGASVKQVPKAVATFEFRTPAGDYVTVAGSRLVARPARRTEQTGDSQWR
jgi:ribonuclease P protein subunit POP4